MTYSKSISGTNMRDHVYPATFVDVTDNGYLLFDIDLGFGIKNENQPFRLYTNGRYTFLDSTWDAIVSWLREAEEVLVKSIRHSIGQYYADVSFRRGEEWYNLLKLLDEENLLWGDTHARK